MTAEPDDVSESAYSGGVDWNDETGRLPLRRASDAVVTAHLEDLQSEMEAGARKLDVLAERASEMHDAILHRHLDQADLAGALVRRVAEVRHCMNEQRERLGELRQAVRDQREPRAR
jgi:hypothetical protein